jgi:hypothetical protein
MFDKITAYLVSDWQKGWRWFTTWFSVSGIAALEVYQQMQTLMPDLVKAFPDSWLHRAMQVLLALILAGRFIKQGPPPDANVAPLVTGVQGGQSGAPVIRP